MTFSTHARSSHAPASPDLKEKATHHPPALPYVQQKLAKSRFAAPSGCSWNAQATNFFLHTFPTRLTLYRHGARAPLFTFYHLHRHSLTYIKYTMLNGP